MERGITNNRDKSSDFNYNNAIVSLDRDIEDICAGLQPQYSNLLRNVRNGDALIIINYIKAMRTESNISDNYKMGIIKLLCKFSRFNKDKPFNFVTKTDILAFLDSFRRAEPTDQMHKWIGTYNTY